MCSQVMETGTLCQSNYEGKTLPQKDISFGTASKASLGADMLGKKAKAFGRHLRTAIS